MLGDRFTTISGSDGSAYRFIEEVMRSQPTGKAAEGQEDGQESEDVQEKKVALKLLLLLKDFDDKLLQEAIKAISR